MIPTVLQAVALPANVTLEDRLMAYVTEYGMRVLAAVLILVLGLWIAKRLSRGLVVALEKKGTDATLIGFLSSMVYGAFVVFVIIAAVGKLGVQATSFVAVIGAAGLAVGLALQGSLSNFASGVLLILFKPFTSRSAVRLAQW